MFGPTDQALQDSIDRRKAAEALQKDCKLLKTIMGYFKKRPMNPDRPSLDGFTLPGPALKDHATVVGILAPRLVKKERLQN